MADLQPAAESVTVYAYRRFEPDLREMQVASHKATRELIESLRTADLLPATAEDVPVAALDAEGRFRRVATGWGALG